MKFPMLIAWPAMLIGTFAAPLSTVAQNYPSKPVRVVTAEQGGGADLPLRFFVPGLVERLGQGVIVDNRGGTVTIPAEIVAKAPPDGYTVLFYGSPMWIIPLLLADAPYDPLRNFAPITLAFRTTNLLLVHPTMPAKSVGELIALAKAKPGVLNYGSGGTGSSTHLGPELLKSMAGIDIVRVPYKGAGPAVTGLIGGEVQLIITSTPVKAHLQSGRLRALAVTSAEPSPLYPGLPTVAATVSGYESSVMFGFFAPAKTPSPIVDRLNRDLVRILGQPDIQERLLNTGSEAVASSPDQFVAAMKSDIARMGKVIKDSGIRAQ